MVTIKDEKIIIEIKSRCPEDDLIKMTNSLMSAIPFINTDILSQDMIYDLIMLLSALYPTEEQLKKIYYENQ
ncbi:MAG: hypothetical protein IJ338_08545 [Bacteroidaceae bacterium]|nr:hypothetical protein [Bacteroidaceae bacterium]